MASWWHFLPPWGCGGGGFKAGDLGLAGFPSDLIIDSGLGPTIKPRFCGAGVVPTASGSTESRTTDVTFVQQLTIEFTRNFD